MIKKIASKTYRYALAHKIVSSVVALAVIGAGYGLYAKLASGSEASRYMLSLAKAGSVSSTITGTGQVAAENQVDVKPAVAGDVIEVSVKPGDRVKKGDVLARLDSADAVKAVNNAELALENAELAYDKAVKQSKDQASDSTISDLKKAYETGYNTIANAFIDLPVIFTGVSDIFYDQSHSPYFADSQIRVRANETAISYKQSAGISFDAAKRAYDAAFARYKTLSVNSDPAEISDLLEDTSDILKELLAALSATYSTIDYIAERYTQSLPNEITSDKSALSGYVSKVNSNITSVKNAISGIEDATDSATSADLAMRSAELSKSQAEDALRDARQALADHGVKAPFDGIVAKVPVKVADKATTGTSVATLITEAKLMNITLNEIDAAKVSPGNKAELTFDAIDGLSLPGHVSNVDLVGTVSQGVVSYSVEIAFDKNDERVKPGMTVNASIVTASKEGVIVVPASAVKTQGGRQYVEVVEGQFDEKSVRAGVSTDTATKRVMIETGISDDTNVEVTSGLVGGEAVVTKTVTIAAAQSSAPSILNSLSGQRQRTSTSGSVRSTGAVMMIK